MTHNYRRIILEICYWCTNKYITEDDAIFCPLQDNYVTSTGTCDEYQGPEGGTDFIDKRPKEKKQSKRKQQKIPNIDVDEMWVF